MKSTAFDLVAIDNHMPEKSGRQMLDEIVTLEEHPPVVFVTGDSDTGDSDVVLPDHANR